MAISYSQHQRRKGAGGLFQLYWHYSVFIQAMPAPYSGDAPPSLHGAKKGCLKVCNIEDKRD
jgi:hypothetical protein